MHGCFVQECAAPVVAFVWSLTGCRYELDSNLSPINDSRYLERAWKI